jgi:hypothetical protein
MSLSVTTPTNAPESSTTGISPQSLSTINEAASCTVLDGLQHAGLAVITSWAFMAYLLIRNRAFNGGNEAFRVLVPRMSATCGA